MDYYHISKNHQSNIPRKPSNNYYNNHSHHSTSYRQYNHHDHSSNHNSHYHNKSKRNTSIRRSNSFTDEYPFSSRHAYRNHNYNHHHYHHHQPIQSQYYTYRKKDYHERSREHSQRHKNVDSPKYHNKYNHMPSKNKTNKNSYKSKSNYSSNNKSSSDSSSSNKVDKGHYKYTIGEVIDGKYKITEFICDGTFGRVVNCRDVTSRDRDRDDEKSRRCYAMKIIRPVKRYIESAEIEAGIIRDILRKDSKSESYCIDMVDTFRFRKNGDEHYVIVFEKVGLSLFEYIKINNYRGFSISQIQKIAYQIFKGIGYLHKIGIIHTDLKPENILLVSSAYESIKDKSKWPSNVTSKDDKTHSYSPSTRSYSKDEDEYHSLINTAIKIIDFGGAVYSTQDHHGIINTRQYRSPEVIMECGEWNEKSDVWSIACILCELYTGELLFATHDNQEHLCLIQKVSGCYPSDMVKNATKEYKQLFYQVTNDEEKKDMYKIDKSRLANQQKVIIALREQETIDEQILGEHRLFVELIESLLRIDPRKRPSCEDALKHPFFTHYYS